MNTYIKVTLIAATIFNCMSCDKRKLEVMDKSELQDITLIATDMSVEWLIGTTRTLTIECNPDFARVSEFELETSDENVFEINQGVASNSFEVTAIGEGESSLKATADGKTAELTFSVYDNSIKKEDLEVKLFMQSTSEESDKTEMMTETTYNSGERFLVTASSICKKPEYKLGSSDETVISAERVSNGRWIIHAGKPGKCELILNVTDDIGNIFDYRYEIMVYGHIDFVSTYNITEYTGGFIVGNHQYDIGNAEIFLEATISGSTWNSDSKVVTKTIEPVSGIYDMVTGAEYPDVIDTSKESNEILAMYEMDGSEKIWYGISGVQLDFIVKLDNPYIIIDSIIDDENREYPTYYNFQIKASLIQEGIASF